MVQQASRFQPAASEDCPTGLTYSDGDMDMGTASSGSSSMTGACSSDACMEVLAGACASQEILMRHSV